MYIYSYILLTFTKEDLYFVEWNSTPNGKGISYPIGFTLSVDRNITLYAQWGQMPKNAVDLGLSVLWATINVGANFPEDYGDYFAWGETQPQSYYDWSTYKWCNGSYNNQTKYNSNSNYGTVDYKTQLELDDDAAYANWGAAWRMPTDAEWTELINNCTWSRTIQIGVNGYKITSKSNGNSIFLPVAGYCDTKLREADNDGWYWSSSHGTDSSPHEASCILFNLNIAGSNARHGNCYRSYGLSIRPVCP